MATDPDSIAREIVGRLEEAWNAGDGPAFGRPFTGDADFVHIRGDHHRGREATRRGTAASSRRSTAAAASATK